VHVTLRTASGLPSFREDRIYTAVRRALAASSSSRFRIAQFSVQKDHLHLLVEADGAVVLPRGCQGLAIRTAKAVNRVLGHRGAVWGDRYHARWLRTPREVRNALCYVLQNFRKHVAGARGLDACSSAPWFTGWTTTRPLPATPSPVAPARTWLARVGWLRHGRLDPLEGPPPALATASARR
jgi:hypothetical protein